MAASMTVAATAQGLGSLPEIMQPEYFSRDLILFIEGLDLTDEQQAISEMIFADYARGFEDGLNNMEAQVEIVAESVQQLGDDKQAIVTAVLAPIQDWAVQRDVMGRRLVENIRVILDEQQQLAWTAFNRLLEREKHLPNGKLSGEQTNLDHVLRDLTLEPQPDTPFADAYLRWELSLSESLQQRMAASTQQLEMLKQIEGNQASDEDVRRRRSALNASVDIRNINDAAIEEWTILLGSSGPAFRKESLKRGYGRIFRTTPVERLFIAAMKLTEVTEDPTLEQAVQDLFNTYLSEVGAINTQLLETVRTWEPELEYAKIENRIRRLRGESTLRPDDPTRKLYQQRRELGIRYAQLLRDLLGDDKFAKIDGATRFMPRVTPPAGQKPTGGKPGGISASGGRKSSDAKLKSPEYLERKRRSGNPNSIAPGKDD